MHVVLHCVCSEILVTIVFSEQFIKSQKLSLMDINLVVVSISKIIKMINTYTVANALSFLTSCFTCMKEYSGTCSSFVRIG